MAGFISIAVKVTDTHERVVKAWERKAVRCLFGAAGYANRTMKSRMRKRKAVSDVGDYPSSHAGQLKDYVAFAVDERTKMAIIGPKLYPGSKDQSQRTKTIPQLINEGGTSIKRVKTQAGKRKTTVIEGRRVYQDNKGRIRKIGGARRLKKSQIEQARAKLNQQQGARKFRSERHYRPRPFVALTLRPAVEILARNLSEIPLQ